MAKMKTTLTELSVDSFLNKQPDSEVIADCKTIIKMMEKTSGEPGKMWGTAIVGFGSYHYKYESGREGEMCLIGFSPRKADITLYVLCGFDGQDDLLSKLGKHKASGGCLHIKKLTDIDLGVLDTIIRKSFADKVKKHQVKS